jgi:glutathione S-transferase
VKVLYSPYSPFVRQVLVVAEERGLAVERVAAQVSPIAHNADVATSNPAGKIPALILADGTALSDSRVIIEYLDALPGRVRLVPEAGAARWRALMLQSMSNALLDAAVLLRYETFMRPEALRWPEWIAGQHAKIDATLDAFEHTHAAALEGAVDVGTIAIGCAIGYLDLRFADHGWRDTRPKLAAWYAKFRERPSMKSTAPPGGLTS